MTIQYESFLVVDATYRIGGDDESMRALAIVVLSVLGSVMLAMFIYLMMRPPKD